MSLFFITVSLWLVVAVAEHNWRTDEGIFFANFTLKEAFVRPVQKSQVATVNYKPGWASISLYDVLEFGASIFETGRWVLDNSFAKDFVEFGSFDFEMARGVDFGGEFKKFGDILAGSRASNKNRCVRQEVKILLEFV